MKRRKKTTPGKEKLFCARSFLRVSYLHDLFKWLLSCEGVYICKICILEEVSWELHPLEGKPKVRYQPSVYRREACTPQGPGILKRPFKPQVDPRFSISLSFRFSSLKKKFLQNLHLMRFKRSLPLPSPARSVEQPRPGHPQRRQAEVLRSDRPPCGPLRPRRGHAGPEHRPTAKERPCPVRLFQAVSGDGPTRRRRGRASDGDTWKARKRKRCLRSPSPAGLLHLSPSVPRDAVPLPPEEAPSPLGSQRRTAQSAGCPERPRRGQGMPLEPDATAAPDRLWGWARRTCSARRPPGSGLAPAARERASASLFSWLRFQLFILSVPRKLKRSAGVGAVLGQAQGPNRP